MKQHKISPSSSTVLTLYVAALAQGLTVVSFPASAALFKAQGLSDAQYGTLFLPQVGFTVLGSLAGPSLSRRVGLGATLSVAFVASTLAAFLLYASSTVSLALALPLLLAGTAAMGTGFGLSAAPLNALPGRLFPNRMATALLALHTMMGVGFSCGPFLAGELIRRDLWRALPLALAVATACLILVCRAAFGSREPRTPNLAPTPGQLAAQPPLPLRESAFWAFVAAAVLYAFSEGTFSNWAIIFLHEERRLPEAVAGSALSIFWGALVVGRVLLSVLVVRVSSQKLWLALPTLMLTAFVAVSSVHSESQAWLAFGFAGLSCSGFFPLTVSLASSRFPAHSAWISSMMTAALMFGVGIASFSIGPLRSVLALAGIYRLSACYPALALLIGAFGTRPRGAATTTAAGATQT
ncbi:MAG: MFS transporter [Myxococcales bacterium]